MERQATHWRPEGLDQFIGQESFIEQVDDEVVAAIHHNRPLPHMFLDGAPGLGKTTIVKVLAAATNRRLVTCMGSSLDEVSLTKILVDFKADGYDRQFYLKDPLLAQPWILFIDECEKMKRTITENLHYVMEPDGTGRHWFMAKKKGVASMVKCGVPAGTVILATNFRGEFAKVGEALLNRCQLQYTFQPYNPENMVKVLHGYAHGVGQDITNDAVMLIANRSLGVPRNGIALFDRTRTKVQAQVARDPDASNIIDSDVVDATCTLLGIDEIGLTDQHRKYLQVLASSQNGTASIESIAAMIRADKDTIKLVEKPLMERMFIMVGSGGRTITEAGLIHLNPSSMDPVLARTID